EEAADTLMELVTPAGHDVATRADIQGVLAAMDKMDTRLSGQLATMDARLDHMDERWEQRSEAMEQRLTATFERGLREAITSQTRALVVSLLVSVVAIAGLAFGLGG
ncbi:MAG: hypothetical protein ACLFV0_12215, partial [Nitriliruptoraceae bacterium]